MPGLLLLFFLASAPQTALPLTVQSVYISEPLKWIAPPKDPDLPKHPTALASLAVFYPGGEFGEAEFWIGRYGNKGPIFIIPGEGFAVSKGKWARNPDGSLAVKYQLVFMEKVISKETVPGPVLEQRWVVRGKAPGRLGISIESPSEKFVAVHAFSNLKTLDDILHEKHESTIK